MAFLDETSFFNLTFQSTPSSSYEKEILIDDLFISNTSFIEVYACDRMRNVNEGYILNLK